MKLFIVAIVLLTGGIFLVPRQKSIAGTWILDTEGKNYEVTLVRIQTREGYFAGTVDIPEQDVYDRPVSIQLKRDSVKIIFDKKETCFVKAAITDSLLIGTSVVCGRSSAVTFRRAK